MRTVKSGCHGGRIGRHGGVALVALAALALTTVSANAEPWFGRWSPNYAWCFQYEAILLEDVLRFSAEEVSFGVEACRVTATEEVTPGARWRLRLSCSGEERIIEVDVSDDALELSGSDEGAPAKRYVRCPETG